MQCPMCKCEESKILDSRSKIFNKEWKFFDTNEIPLWISSMDYRLRRHKCKTCGYTFSTIETYFNPEDIERFKKDEKSTVYFKQTS